MFMESLADRQVSQRVAPQIEAVEMTVMPSSALRSLTGRHFGTFVPGIVGGRFVPMSILGKALIVG